MQKNTSIPQSGALIVPMTNDYLFRALLQRNNLVLKGLICALLHMKEADISSVIITNPIRLGDSIDNKTFVLDINVILNQHHIINLEMQVKYLYLLIYRFKIFSYWHDSSSTTVI